MTERRRYRLPREERMRGYQDVELRHADQPFDAFEGATPVAVELRRDAESLIDFDHPDRAVYVFGPEDGSLDRAVLGLCHRFVVIPTRSWGGGFDEPDHMADAVGVR